MPAKLVAIGDSLTHGVQSGSISRTHLSYPALIAECLGDTLDRETKNFQEFKIPDFSGEGGIPLNIENLFRKLAQRYGSRLSWLEFIPAKLTIGQLMDAVEDYWERGEGIMPSNTGPLHRNLAVLGLRLGDCDTLTEAICRRTIPPARDNLISQVPEFAVYRAARRTLNPSFFREFENLSQITAAQQIAVQSGGIENLIFWLGSNNCLGTVIDLEIRWSQEADLQKLSHQQTCNLWHPEHFQKLLDRIAPKIAETNAQNVFVATIPHVTIPPVSRGITPGATGEQALSDDGYFEFYTHFWVWDEDFSKNPHKYPYLTRDEVRHIDRVVDEYNKILRHEADRRGWYVVDLCTQLDRLAFRRQNGKTQYPFPQELVDALKHHPATQDRFTETGKPILDTRYLRCDLQATEPQKRYQGGIISLDGIHPTTITYGLIAHEFLTVMTQKAGFQLQKPLNWEKVVTEDTLVTDLPANLANLRDILGFLYSQGVLLSLINAFTKRSS